MENTPTGASVEIADGLSNLPMEMRPDEQSSNHSMKRHDSAIADETVGREQAQSANKSHAMERAGSSWKRTYLRIAPLTGIACIMFAVASIVAALGILVGSRGAAVSTWTVPPSTYLAICTAIVNQALRFAAFHGLAISWWFRATRGDTLAQLHHSWHAGMTVGGALIAGRRMGLIGLACLCSTLVAIDGPLLQKATTIELAPIDLPPVTLSVRIYQEVPTDYTGGWVDYDQRESQSFNDTVPTIHGNTSNLIYTAPVLDGTVETRWYKNDTIPKVVSGCPTNQTCRAKVRAPALAVSKCVFRKQAVDYWIPLVSGSLKNVSTKTAAPFGTLGFLSAVNLLLGEKESINLISGYGDYDNCTGTFYYKYDIMVSEGDRVQVIDGNPQIVALANNTRVNRQWDPSFQFYPSTLAGVVGFAALRFNSAVNFYRKGNIVYESGYTPTVYAKYTTLNGGHATYCWSYNNPQQDTIRDLNTFMFLLGVQAASGRDQPDLVEKTDPGLPVNTTTLGYLEGTHEVFATNLYWFAGAVVVELVCIALILPTYFGWWTLGRSVSFSPLELAKAFEAPLLSDCNSNATGREIAKAVGKTHIKYGQLGATTDKDSTPNQPKLAFGDPDVISKPQSDEKYGP